MCFHKTAIARKKPEAMLGAYPPIIYAAAVTRLAQRPNPAAFVTFLSSPDGSALLGKHGLEAQ